MDLGSFLTGTESSAEFKTLPTKTPEQNAAINNLLKMFMSYSSLQIDLCFILFYIKVHFFTHGKYHIYALVDPRIIESMN